MDMTHRLRIIFLPLVCLLLNSCYFNTTGWLCNQASYEAYATTSDMEQLPHPRVYANSRGHYIELPRYTAKAPANIQRHLFEAPPASPPERERRGTGLFLIPADYAAWLTGSGPKVRAVSYLEEVEDADLIKMTSMSLPVVKPSIERSVVYAYRSPNADWMYAATPFSFLLVDLPVTVAENAVVIGGVFVLAYFESTTPRYVDHSRDNDCDHKQEERPERPNSQSRPNARPERPRDSQQTASRPERDR
ncbi:MAG: hypothetical protein IKJ58_03940 [Akkermansia sp.]|nr:hypothetical protein [Akkermansia sp.]